VHQNKISLKENLDEAVSVAWNLEWPFAQHGCSLFRTMYKYDVQKWEKMKNENMDGIEGCKLQLLVN